MIKLVHLVGAAALTAGFAGSAFAEDHLVDLVVEPAAAGAVGDWYVSLFAGAASTNDVGTLYGGTDYTVSFDPGYTLGIAVGKHFSENLRGEIELSGGSAQASAGSNDFDPGYDVDGSISTKFLLGNLWYDIDAGTGFTPYVGGGVGVGFATADTTFDGNTYGYGEGGSGFAFQLGTGVTFDVADNMKLDIGYRYKSIRGVDFADSDGEGVYEDGDVNSHTVQVGLTIPF